MSHLNWIYNVCKYLAFYVLTMKSRMVVFKIISILIPVKVMLFESLVQFYTHIIWHIIFHNITSVLIFRVERFRPFLIHTRKFLTQLQLNWVLRMVFTRFSCIPDKDIHVFHLCLQILSYPCYLTRGWIKITCI